MTAHLYERARGFFAVRTKMQFGMGHGIFRFLVRDFCSDESQFSEIMAAVDKAARGLASGTQPMNQVKFRILPVFDVKKENEYNICVIYGQGTTTKVKTIQFTVSPSTGLITGYGEEDDSEFTDEQNIRNAQSLDRERSNAMIDAIASATAVRPNYDPE